jgi:hypothetical protein
MDCEECTRLRAAFGHIVQKNLDLLSEYQAAVLAYQEDKLTSLRDDLREIESFRREARLKLHAHRAIH